MVASINKVPVAFMQSVVQTASVDRSLDVPRVRIYVEKTCLQCECASLRLSCDTDIIVAGVCLPDSGSLP